MKPTVTVVSVSDNFDQAHLTGAILMEAAKAGGFVIEGAAKINASRGRPGLEVKTGALVGSITTTEAKSTKTRADVDVGPSVLYAKIHEFGGIIVPVVAKMLSWVSDAGERIFANAVHIPARPYMRPAIDENEDRVVKAVETEIHRQLDKVGK